MMQLIAVFLLILNTCAYTLAEESLIQAPMNLYPEIKDCLNTKKEGDRAWRKYAANVEAGSDKIYIKDGIIQIDLQVQLRYQSYFSKEEFADAVELIEHSKSGIEYFYLRHGIKLNLSFLHEAFDFTSRSGHPMPTPETHVVYIRRNTGSHMKSTYWGVNADWDNDLRTKLYTHEVSHLRKISRKMSHKNFMTQS